MGTQENDTILNQIDMGWGVNALNPCCQTPLNCVVRRFSIDTAHKLIKSGANIDAQDGNGWSPLHEAVDANKTESICMLLYYGADVNILNRNRHTPFVQSLERRVFIYNLETASWLLNYHDKFGGSFTSRENYPNMFRNPANQPLDERKQLRLVTQIWKKLDHHTMLRDKSLFLSSYILESKFLTARWLNGLNSMLDTPDAAELMTYKFHTLDACKISHFSDVFPAFRVRDVSRHDRVGVIALWLSFGAQVYLQDILEAYFQFGVNHEVMLLIFATPVPLLTLFLALEEHYGTGREFKAVFLHEFVYNVCKAGVFEMAVGFIARSLLYFSWDDYKRKAIEDQCVVKEGDKRITTVLEKTPIFPSLVENCRNVIARTIQKNVLRKHKKTRTPLEYHEAVEKLGVTTYVKDILNFKRPLYI